MKGGNCAGAAAHGTLVYGAAGTQQAVPGSNVIQMKGGKKKSKGGNILSDMALPASLMYANHTFGKRRSTKKHVSRKNRKSRRFRRTYRR
jgi:hypothetical protein